MEFKPVIVKVSRSSNGGVLPYSVECVDVVSYALFDNVRDFRTVSKEDSSTIAEGYSTNSAYILNPYKLFGAVFDKTGKAVATDVASVFRVYDLHNYLVEKVGELALYKAVTYECEYDSYGGSTETITVKVVKEDGTNVGVVIDSNHKCWAGLKKDLLWEQNQARTLKGKDVLDAVLLLENYPGFK